MAANRDWSGWKLPLLAGAGLLTVEVLMLRLQERWHVALVAFGLASTTVGAHRLIFGRQSKGVGALFEWLGIILLVLFIFVFAAGF